MFEYSALVDAPVQRFTGIVTGPDPDAEPMTLSVMTPPGSVGVAVAAAPVMLVAEAAEAAEAAEPLEPVKPIAEAAEPLVPPIARRVLPAPLSTPSALRPHSPRQPSIVPAVIAIAATAVATTLWLRRGLRGHDR